jgi:SAM-dependent methyltransferase
MTKSGYKLFRCPSCGLGQTKLGKPYEEFVKEFYTDGYFMGDKTKSAYTNYAGDKKYIQRNMQTFLTHLMQYKKSGNVLDAGCACGYFVESALSKGFDAYGFDPSHYALSHASEKIKHRVAHSSISDSTYEKASFDAITMFDVFEHLGDPITDLKKLGSYLKDDGVMMIATGDTESVAARILKRRWTFYIPPQHLFFFNKKTITETLKRAGFEPITFFRIGKWLSLSYVLHLASTSGESSLAPILQRIVTALHLGSFPLYIPLQDNMVVIARKSRQLDGKTVRQEDDKTGR